MKNEELVERLQEAIGRYGVQCSETKILAPTNELVNVFAEINDALSAQSAAQGGVREGMMRAAGMAEEMRLDLRNRAILAQRDVMVYLPNGKADTLDKLRGDITRAADSLPQEGQQGDESLLLSCFRERERKQRQAQQNAGGRAGSVNDGPNSVGCVSPAPSAPDSVTVPRDVIDGVGSWLSAAMDDPKVCVEMKRDIEAFFEATK